MQNITVKLTLPKKYLDEAQGDLQKAIKLSKDQVEFKPEYVAETNYRFRGKGILVSIINMSNIFN